jgi:hypothetical protein
MSSKYEQYLEQLKKADKLLADAQAEKLAELTKALENVTQLIRSAKNITPLLNVDELAEWKTLFTEACPTKGIRSRKSKILVVKPTNADIPKILKSIGVERVPFGIIGKEFGWHHLAVKGFTSKHTNEFNVTAEGVKKA